jgi:hypothetical protein
MPARIVMASGKGDLVRCEPPHERITNGETR